MDERRTGEGGGHLDEERLALGTDDPGALGAADREHLDLCAVCRTEIDRLREVGRLVADLGAAYREAAPPEWPAAAAIEARAREGDPDGGWLPRLAAVLGLRARSLGAALAVGLVALVAAAVVLVATRPAADAASPGTVAAASPDVPRVAVAPPAPDAARYADVEPGGALEAPAVPAAPGRAANSSVVAVSAGRNVSYVMMNVPYEGGTTTVLWLSEIPAAAGAVNLPM